MVTLSTYIRLAAGFTSIVAASTQAQKSLTADGQSTPFTDEVVSLVEEVMSAWKIPGLSMAVIDGDEVYTEAFGYAAVPDVKATPETLYYAGSTTKAFVAATLAHIIDSKNHSALSKGWKTSISSIIRDDFVLEDAWATANLNLEDAASHRTGFPRHDLAWPRVNEDGSRVTTAALVRNLRNLEPSAPPRTTWQYCNLMYVVIGHVIETITGKWLGDAVREAIWEPLGMNSTFGDTLDALGSSAELAAGYHWNFAQGKQVQMEMESSSDFRGAGMIISTVVDYSKWVKCLLDQTAPFSNATHADIRHQRMLGGYPDAADPTGKADSSYGLGWKKTTYHGEIAYYHGGTSLSHASQVYWLPELRFGVVAMANTDVANYAEDAVVWRLIEDKLDMPNEKRFSFNSSLEEALENDDKGIKLLPGLFYPNKPETPIPSSLNDSQVVGKYFNPGYGRLNILEAEIDGESMLVANRTDMMIPNELRFRHDSGNYWMAYIFLYVQNTTASAWGAEFKVGVDGQTSGLDIRLTPPVDGGVDQGIVWFKKID